MAEITQLSNPAWGQAGQEATERLAQRNQIKEQQRVQQQNTVGAQLLDAINNAGNIKPQTKDEDGNIIHNPEYDTAQQAKTKLLQQYTALNTPEQHASFADRLHGLIFGHPTPHTQQPALTQNSSPNEPPPPAVPTPIPGQSDIPAPPPHPFSTLPSDHPASKITEGISALGNHLKAFAHPLNAPPAPDPALMAKYQRDPTEVQFERNKEIWGVRGQNALDLQDKKNEYLKAQLAARPPRFLSQTTVPDLLEQMKVDPTMSIYAPDGHEVSPAQLSEMPAGTIAREFKAGSTVFYALGDQNSKTLNVNGQIYDIPAVGQVNIAGPKQNSSVVGQATSTLPKQATDAFGTTTTSKTIVPPVSSAAPAPPSATPPEPVLHARPNPGARTPGTQPQGGAVKGPVSAAAPSIPTAVPPLDADGHIPAGYGNDLARQYANNLLDGQDSSKIPNPRARAAAEQMASKFGWSQGTFTPKEKVQFQIATNFLDQLQKSPALDVLDNFVSREKIARAMKAPKDMSIIDRVAAYNLTPQESEFIKLFNAAAGTVQGLSSITRAGRATDSTVNRLQQELPNVFQSASSKDAKGRIGQLLKEANDALQTNPMKVGKGGPVSKNAPQVGSWKPPADAPPAPKEDGKVLKADGKVIAISQGGNWTDPNAH